MEEVVAYFMERDFVKHVALVALVEEGSRFGGPGYRGDTAAPSSSNRR